jgi:hypothetical protein
MTRRNRPEEIIHRAVVDYLLLALPAGVVFFHVPNGGKRSKTEGKRFKEMGVRAGVPDLVFILPAGRAAFAEIKSPDGSLTPGQKLFKEDVEELGCPWVEVKSIDDMKAALQAWGVIK